MAAWRLVVFTALSAGACPVSLNATLRLDGVSYDVDDALPNEQDLLKDALCRGPLGMSAGCGTASITLTGTAEVETAVSPPTEWSTVQLTACLQTASGTAPPLAAAGDGAKMLQTLTAGASAWNTSTAASFSAVTIDCASCAHCPAATHAKTGTTSRCSRCGDGFHAKSPNSTERADGCIQCPTGHAGTGGTCAECTGSYGPNKLRTECSVKVPVWKENWFLGLMAAIIVTAVVVGVFRKMLRRALNKESPEPDALVPKAAGKAMVTRDTSEVPDDEEDLEPGRAGQQPAAFKL
eukprot:g6400.t1